MRRPDAGRRGALAARAQGYALVDEEFGLVSVAASVRDFKGQLVAALRVSAPKFHLGERLERGEEVKTVRTSSPPCSAVPLEQPNMLVCNIAPFIILAVG
jgi:DNA-binding IclR family transcriptional regulator